jgi:membrane AbrB-like protein
VQVIALMLAATVGGLILRRLGVPGGLPLGAMLGAAAYTLTRDAGVVLPSVVQDGALVVLGAVVGATVTRSMLGDLKALLVPALIAAVLIVTAGIAVALLLRWFGAAPPDDVLATSPGALSAVLAIAVDRGVAPAQVALFHTVRLLVVMGTLPLVVLLLPKP